MKRFSEGMTGISGVVVHDGKVHAVAFDPNLEEGISQQTENALRYLDELLMKAGSNKTRLIQATVYLSDIGQKKAMDEVWLNWIGGEENRPQRACVGVDLSPECLIEIVVVAAEV
ncbi:MAG: RidA family protein [Pseudomonadota bacterium]